MRSTVFALFVNAVDILDQSKFFRFTLIQRATRCNRQPVVLLYTYVFHF